MKNILKLNGVKELSKETQSQLRGAGSFISCCGGNKCRISFPGGSFCEPGRCLQWGGCILY